MEKRGRGRPKGSKNKPKIAKVEEKCCEQVVDTGCKEDCQCKEGIKE